MSLESFSPLFEAEAGWQDRKDEIDRYFEFVGTIINRRCMLAPQDEAGMRDGELLPIDIKTTRVMMAIGYIALYNLLESTIRNYVVAIHLDMVRNGVRVEDTRSCVRETVIKGFKEHANATKVGQTLSDLGRQAIEHGMCRDKLFSGNVDARELRKTADRYGFRCPQVRGMEDTLKVIKENRTELAHGLKSFTECVQHESIDDLLAKHRDVVGFLERLTRNMREYLEERAYLQPPPEGAQ